MSPSDPREALEALVERVGHLLPAQGPISVFIHHNTLHAFEHLRFEEAVQRGARLFGCEPWLGEDEYRDALRRGRIHASDVDAVLAAELGARGEEIVVGELSRRELRSRLVLHGLPALSGPVLGWTLDETRASTELRADLPADARESLDVSGRAGADGIEEAHQVQALFRACRDAAGRSEDVRASPPPIRIRHRDLLLEAFDIDADEWVHPVLIRLTSAYLDQGLADWSMPGRERGLFACFLDCYRHRIAWLSRPLGPELRNLVRDELGRSRDAWESLAASLSQLGISAAEREAFLTAEALALRGFAGMVRQLETRPDRVPKFPLPARLVDFLATRMLILRAALRHAAHLVGFGGELSAFRGWLEDRGLAPTETSDEERAWPLFHVAQLAGLSAQSVNALAVRDVAVIERELFDFDGIARRHVLHQAYERHLRHRFFDALVQHRPRSVGGAAYQAIFCIDEREESMRRHLEEVDPEVETFGAAGFFGVAMYYRGSQDAHPRPLCPVAIRPRHFVAEVELFESSSLGDRWRRGWERVGALVDKNIHLGGRHAGRGAVLLATIGVLWVLPLVFRVVFPWLRRGVTQLYGKLYSPGGRLALEHTGGEPRPSLGEQTGFTADEMADIVLSQLQPIGIRERFAPLVLVVGHGSTSLNNPHESAHDCGACGGGRGGPNARAFAQMANHPAVRALVSARGLEIPRDTWFVGGQRNTANNDIELFDEAEVPACLSPLLARAWASLEEARRREAHERCRRFHSAPLWLPPPAALFHVQARATDLAQPRPEYGHASNAMCIIGRRRRTRGLFLDRRAFLVSYDPEGDTDGALLAEVLASVVPVVAGISLEYLFGYVDKVGYGCGTKLPHNVTALVGVMDGGQSDLRTGLPSQMLEIHEPVRLCIVVEAEASLVARLLSESADLQRLVDHQWIFVAALEPSSETLVELGARDARPYAAEHTLRRVQGSSQTFYDGHRGHLPFVALEADPASTS